MDSVLETLIIPLAALIGVAFGALILGGIFFVVHLVLTGPMRRAGRAKLFLDLVELALDRGQPVEEALMSAARCRDRILGWHFPTFVAVLASGRKLADALEFVPRILPRQIVGMLRVGQQIGDLRKVLPACRQLLRDSVSATRSAVNYVVVLAFVVTPFTLLVFAVLCVKVVPTLRAIQEGMGSPAPFATFIWENFYWIVSLELALVTVLWFLALLYALGPRVNDWLPILHRVHFRMPWRRKRMSRDFSAMLAVLLDARVPESEAIPLAADCTANRIFQKRAARVAELLKQGVKLTDAITAMDDSGEFRWRLANAAHAAQGFRAALAGWHEALDAKAFQLEQTAAHSVTTALVLLNGVFVGAVVFSVFSFLISIVNAGLLW